MLETNSFLGHGGAGFQGTGSGSAAAAIKEIQGLTFTPVAGAVAGTKMDVPALRLEDTLVAVLQGTAGVFVEDKANCSIVDVRASGTVTVALAAENDTVTVNDVVYTFKAARTAATHVKWTSGNNNANAAALAAVINEYEGRYGNVAEVVATAASAVVTVRAVAEGTGGNLITLASSNGTRLAVTGSGTLAGGTATGGITSTTNNSGKAMLVIWFDKNA